ncbi:MAG: hypothetical protein J3R72DRAFT_473350 [Linnemannia gamsii]|nr:MAG: hypothetical protein J3R72DRAFT_473350 [Linnemannia gamsii]
MVTATRLNPPPVFTGVRDGFSALAWLVAVNRYFNLAKIKDDERTPMLSLIWPHLSEFTPAFKLEYIPNNFAGACRRHLTNLRMTTNFSTYLTTFKELLGALLGYAATEAAQTTVNEFAQTSFIDNCPLVLQQMIEGHLIQNPNTTLVQIFQYAQEMDRIYSFKPDTGPKTNSSVIASAPIISSLTPSSSSSHATAMEVDHIQVALNNINRRFNQLEKNMGRNNTYNHTNHSSYTNNRNNNGHPSPLSPEDREWCKQTIAKVDGFIK